VSSSWLLGGIVAPACDRPALRGSFLQPALGDRWTSQQWEKEFSYMKKAGIDQMVLQWTADSKNHTTIYPSGLTGYTQNTKHDVVERALRTADQSGAQVFLGLQINDDWWTYYASNGPWLKNETKVANALVDDLWKRYSRHRSLAGWYLSFEVDNVNESKQKQWDRLVDFYKTVADHLHKITPGKPVMISPFFNAKAGMTPAQWQTMWEYILAGAPLDVLALQDGVGVGHATAQQLPQWFQAVHDAIQHARPRMQFWVDSETFNRDSQPMAIRQLVEDMRAVQPYVSYYLSFSFNHYLSPQQVNPLYYKTYLRYLKTSRVESQPPTKPTGLEAEALDSMTISLSWDPSTDNLGVVGYKAWRDNKHVATLYDAETSFVDSGLEPNTTYTYEVAAFDAAGNTSARSDPASATTSSGDPYKTNLALGKPYTATMAADPSYLDTGGIELTDGIFATIDYTDPAWQGRSTDLVYSFTIDLGSVEDLKEIRTRWLQYRVAGIHLPGQVGYSVSNDGVNFTSVGVVSKPKTDKSNQPAWYTLTALDKVSGRYVKLDVTPSSDVWTFLDEAEVRR
jgi:chitodextrinase